MRYELKRPIPALDGRTLSVVEIRDYTTVGDLLAAVRDNASEDELGQSATLTARLCGLDVSEVMSMDVDDFAEIARMIAAKKATGQTISEKP